MMGIVIFFHVIACIGLIGVVLVQRGRGGGFIEGFSGLDSVFGTKTSQFLTRFTSVFAIMFFITCLLLAVMSVQRNRSIMRNIKLAPSEQPQAPAAAAEPAAGQTAPQAASAAPAAGTTAQ